MWRSAGHCQPRPPQVEEPGGIRNPASRHGLPATATALAPKPYRHGAASQWSVATPPPPSRQTRGAPIPRQDQALSPRRARCRAPSHPPRARPAHRSAPRRHRPRLPQAAPRRASRARCPQLTDFPRPHAGALASRQPCLHCTAQQPCRRIACSDTQARALDACGTPHRRRRPEGTALKHAGALRSDRGNNCRPRCLCGGSPSARRPAPRPAATGRPRSTPARSGDPARSCDSCW
jgi:hypothetical protein